MSSRGWGAGPMQTVKVKILDQEYLVRSLDSAEDVQRIAAYVDRVAGDIREASEGLSERKVAILAAMHIAGEHFQALKALDEKESRESQRIKAMIYDIDSTMGS